MVVPSKKILLCSRESIPSRSLNIAESWSTWACTGRIRDSEKVQLNKESRAEGLSEGWVMKKSSVCKGIGESVFKETASQMPLRSVTFRSRCRNRPFHNITFLIIIVRKQIKAARNEK